MKRLSIVILLLASMMPLYAQHGGRSDVKANPWWIGGSAGVNMWKFERAGFLAGLETGRWMNPVWGLSLRLSAFSVNGEQQNTFGMSAMGTVTVDWNNVGGVDLGRLHVYTPVSVGAAFSEMDSRMKVSPTFSAAVGLRYGLGRMALFGEAGVMLAKFGEWGPMPTFSLGLRFPLSSKREVSYVPKSQLPAMSSDNEPRGLVDDMLATNEKLNLPALVVRFSRDEKKLNANALRQLNLFASQLNSMDWEDGFYIIGTADDVNASQRHNRKLCEKRCQAVYKVLVEEFDVDEDLLQVLPQGGFSEYSHQYSEQMVLIIQCTPETEEVVERWIATY